LAGEEDAQGAQDYILAASTEADLDAIMEIDQLSFPVPWERQSFADELSRSWARLQVLREASSGRVVAFCNYWLVAGEMHILNIAVHPQARRQGHAAHVLRLILAEAKNRHVDKLSLEVRVSNQAAQALYRKFGFHEVGTRPRYYANNGEDALLMDLELGS
jgi:ribosomal-protein-alanine N-acetyltransferase